MADAITLPSSLSPAETPLYNDKIADPLQSLDQSAQNVEPLEENGPSDNFSSYRFNPSDIKEWPVEVLSYLFERYFYELYADKNVPLGALPSITELLLYNPFFNALCLDSRYSNSLGDVVLLPLLESISIDVFDPFQWDRLLGFRHRYHYDGDTRTILPGRPSLKKLSVCRHYSSTDRAVDDDASSIDSDHVMRSNDPNPQSLPDDLIDGWDTFSELLELREEIELDLTVRREVYECDPDWDDLFKLSFRKLEITHGEAPEYIKESKCTIDDWKL